MRAKKSKQTAMHDDLKRETIEDMLAERMNKNPWPP